MLVSMYASQSLHVTFIEGDLLAQTCLIVHSAIQSDLLRERSDMSSYAQSDMLVMYSTAYHV